MKNTLIGLIFIWCTISLQAQTYSHTFKIGDTADEYALNNKVDEEGNVYVLGGYKNSIDFGKGVSLTTQGNPAYGLYVAKFDGNGDVVWAVNGGTDGEELFYMDLDTAGNVYVAGSFIGTQTYGANTYTTLPNESNDNFLMKIDEDGKVVWTRHLQGPDHEHVQGMVVGENGDIYVSGFFDSTFMFEGTTLMNNGSSDIFVMKFDKDNNFKWATAGGGSDSEWPWDLALDDANNLYLVGRIESSFKWDSEQVTLVDVQDMLLVKLDASNGQAIYAKVYGGQGQDEAKGVSCDADGNVFVSGYFSVSINFGTVTKNSNGTKDGIIFKLNNQGDFQWAEVFGGTSSETLISYPEVDQYRNVYVGGSFIKDITAGGVTYTYHGSRDAFLARYLSNGQFDGAIILGGTQNDYLGGFNVNTNGSAWLCGRFTSKEMEIGGTKLLNNGSATTDIFITEIHGFAVGIESAEAQENNDLVYPNPSTGVVHFNSEISSQDRGFIRNAMGQIVYNFQVHKNSIDLSNLSNGMYFITIQNSSQEYEETHKIIIQK